MTSSHVRAPPSGRLKIGIKHYVCGEVCSNRSKIGTLDDYYPTNTTVKFESDYIIQPEVRVNWRFFFKNHFKINRDSYDLSFLSADRIYKNTWLVIFSNPEITPVRNAQLSKTNTLRAMTRAIISSVARPLPLRTKAQAHSQRCVLHSIESVRQYPLHITVQLRAIGWGHACASMQFSHVVPEPSTETATSPLRVSCIQLGCLYAMYGIDL